MKKLYTLILTLAASTLLFAQNTPNQLLNVNGKAPIAPTYVPSRPAPNPNALPQTQVVLDYDSADNEVWTGMGTNYNRFIWDFNMHYDSIDLAHRYFVVSFDTMYDINSGNTTLNSVIQNIVIDSLTIFLGQENNSGIADTLILKIVSLTAKGYPTGTVVWSDTMIIPGNAPFGNNWLQAVYFNWPVNYTHNGNKFGARLEYYGDKRDTCGFLAGYGDRGACNTSSTSAYYTNFSHIFRQNSTTAGFYQNSVSLWTKYIPYGTLPTNNGANIYYDCDQSGGYTPGSDGENYIQNILMQAHLTLNTNIGFDETNAGIKISQNQPNPFSVNTTIQYELVNSANVTLSVYDITGALVSTQNMGNLSAGKHQATINGTDLNAGIYFYTFNVNGSTVTKKMTVIK